MIYECLLAKDDITDCTLQMYIGDALGDLQTNTSFEIEHRKPSNTRPRNILYFTKKCLTEPEALPNRIQEIFDVYLDGNNGYNYTAKKLQRLESLNIAEKFSQL